MDRIDKSLQKLSEKEKTQIKRVLLLIRHNRFQNLDVKKLKGYKNIFRVRKGSYRIIFQQFPDRIKILALEHRSENTYKF